MGFEAFFCLAFLFQGFYSSKLHTYLKLFLLSFCLHWYSLHLLNVMVFVVCCWDLLSINALNLFTMYIQIVSKRVVVLLEINFKSCMLGPFSMYFAKENSLYLLFFYEFSWYGLSSFLFVCSSLSLLLWFFIFLSFLGYRQAQSGGTHWKFQSSS